MLRNHYDKSGGVELTGRAIDWPAVRQESDNSAVAVDLEVQRIGVDEEGFPRYVSELELHMVQLVCDDFHGQTFSMSS